MYMHRYLELYVCNVSFPESHRYDLREFPENPGDEKTWWLNPRARLASPRARCIACLSICIGHGGCRWSRLGFLYSPTTHARLGKWVKLGLPGSRTSWWGAGKAQHHKTKTKINEPANHKITKQNTNINFWIQILDFLNFEFGIFDFTRAYWGLLNHKLSRS